MGRMGLVVKGDVGHRATDPLVEEQKQQGYLDTFGSQPVAHSGAGP